MDVQQANQISTEVLEACQVEAGKLVLSDERFLAFGARINDATDKKAWATALVALVQRLREVPGAAAAAERVNALAAFALGDPELSQLLNRELRKKSR